MGEVKRAVDSCWRGLYKEVLDAKWDKANPRVPWALERMVTTLVQNF